MKRFAILATASLALTLLLGGCASTIRSDVTTFQQWPAQLTEKTYAFDTPAAQDDTLEYRSYQNNVRAELAQLGLSEVASAPAMKVSMRFSTTEQPVRVLQIQDPYGVTARFGYFRPPRFGYWGWYSPIYDPFWANRAAVTEDLENVYQRELQIAIRACADGKRLFDVTVHNLSKEASTPLLMPALVHSAFVGFPGPNGVARKIELKQNG